MCALSAYGSIRSRGTGERGIAIMQWRDGYVCRGKVQVTVALGRSVIRIRSILDVGIKMTAVGRMASEERGVYK